MFRRAAGRWDMGMGGFQATPPMPALLVTPQSVKAECAGTGVAPLFSGLTWESSLFGIEPLPLLSRRADVYGPHLSGLVCSRAGGQWPTGCGEADVHPENPVRGGMLASGGPNTCGAITRSRRLRTGHP